MSPVAVLMLCYAMGSLAATARARAHAPHRTGGSLSGSRTYERDSCSLYATSARAYCRRGFHECSTLAASLIEHLARNVDEQRAAAHLLLAESVGARDRRVAHAVGDVPGTRRDVPTSCSAGLARGMDIASSTKLSTEG